MDKFHFRVSHPLPDGILVTPRQTAAKISLSYAAASWVWILTSDNAVPYLTKDLAMMVTLNSLKGFLFIFVTASILYCLVSSQLWQVWRAQSRYIQRTQELENAHEKLTLTDEELRQQLDELTVNASIIEEKDREMWALFENMHDAFAVCEIVLDDQGLSIDYRFLKANPAYEVLVGRTNNELIGHCVLEIFPEMDHDFIKECGIVALSGTTKKLDIFSKILGKYMSVSIFSHRHGLFAIIARDISDEKMHERVVERLAYYDTLTGLPNRVKLNALLTQEMAANSETSPSGALLYIDMDDLKLVNDSYGHSYGDAMIITAAMHMVSLTESNSIVARVGGDEFIVLIPGITDPHTVGKTASEYLEVLSREYQVKELRFDASVSIGVIIYPQDGTTAEEILRNADTALYEAKRHGKRCWRFFRQSMQETAYTNMLLINGLRNAVANHELEVYYQPQISLLDGSVTAFEALLRWHSPLFGNVSPAQFIPLAEKSHLIESIGAWTLREAFGFSSKLADEGYPEVRVAVNVSPRQLIAADFIQIIRGYVEELNLKTSRLEIEVTENILIESMVDSVRKLNELRALGIHLSLDDFGIGYSSLTYLRSLPVQTLKIDKSFIDLISTDKHQSAFIASIINMAHVLDLSVVAEGVETSEQLEILLQCDCNKIQGFLVSRAVPASDAIKFLQNDAWAETIKTRTASIAKSNCKT